MCQRRENEPWMLYAFRWLAEQPKLLLAFAGCAAAVGVYIDHRSFVLEQVQALREVSTELRTINARLEHLEREHEQQRLSK